MKQFTDSQGRKWEIVVNVGSAKRVRSTLGVDLFNIQTTEANRVLGDPCMLVDVLYVLCEQQAKERGVSDVSFGEGMIGDAILSATDALMDAVADFFPQGRRELLRSIKMKAEELTKKQLERAMTEVQKLDLDTLMPTSSKPSTNSPASSS